MQFARSSKAVTFFLRQLHITTVSPNQFILHVPLLFLVECLCICQLPTTRCYICTIRSWSVHRSHSATDKTEKRSLFTVYLPFMYSLDDLEIDKRFASSLFDDIFNYGEYRIAKERICMPPFLLFFNTMRSTLPFAIWILSWSKWYALRSFSIYVERSPISIKVSLIFSNHCIVSLRIQL